jgi:hypothetical protein
MSLVSMTRQVSGSTNLCLVSHWHHVLGLVRLETGKWINQPVFGVPLTSYPWLVWLEIGQSINQPVFGVPLTSCPWLVWLETGQWINQPVFGVPLTSYPWLVWRETGQWINQPVFGVPLTSCPWFSMTRDWAVDQPACVWCPTDIMSLVSMTRLGSGSASLCLVSHWYHVLG